MSRDTKSGVRDLFMLVEANPIPTPQGQVGRVVGFFPKRTEAVEYAAELPESHRRYLVRFSAEVLP